MKYKLYFTGGPAHGLTRVDPKPRRRVFIRNANGDAAEYRYHGTDDKGNRLMRYVRHLNRETYRRVAGLGTENKLREHLRP